MHLLVALKLGRRAAVSEAESALPWAPVQPDEKSRDGDELRWKRTLLTRRWALRGHVLGRLGQ